MSKWKKIRNRVGYSNYFMVSSIGRKGSLALMWHNDIDLKIVNFSNNHISFEIRLDNMGTKCVLIESYGSPETYKRAAFKDFLD